MSFIVHSNSSHIILPLRIKAARDDGPPILESILLSQSKPGGLRRHFLIPMGEQGVQRPFAGDCWCHEWRRDGDALWALWLGFPDAFFSTSLEPWSLVTVEAWGRQAEGASLSCLSHIEVTIRPTGLGHEGAVVPWMPDATPRTYPSTDETG